MSYVPTKEVKIKERQDKFLRAQLEKEREQALLEEIEKTEKERVKKKGTVIILLISEVSHVDPNRYLFSYSLGLKVLK